jgi:hypothetical protein
LEARYLKEQKNVTESHTTLGCKKNMVGDDKDHMDKLKQLSDLFASQIKNCNLTRKQIMMAFNMMYIPSMKYSLPATSLTLENMEQIQNYAINKFLPAIGYDRSTPRDSIFGPDEVGGFNIRHLFAEMMGMKLDSIISHIKSDLNLGKAMVINMNYIQLISGLETPILESLQNIPYMETNWIQHIWDFLRSRNAKLNITSISYPRKARHYDQFIMLLKITC